MAQRRQVGLRAVLLGLGLILLPALPARALDFSNRYRSPRNAERRIRPATRLIVLHTTEAPARSSLNKLSERGEAHYCVTEDGTVYRIIDRDRVAFHAGRSMWNGHEDCDDFAVGIEVVGYHDKPMSLRQLNGLRELVTNLKKIYGISDANVICHSHVAYGAPNRWQTRRHRGRKRCGMLFAMWSVRTRLGLTARPAVDPDVRAGRLIQADRYLEGVLYGKTDTMVARYANGRDPGAAAGGGLFAGLGRLLGFGGAKENPAAKAPVVKPVVKPAAKPATAKPSVTPAAAKSTMQRSTDVVAGSLKVGAKLIVGTANKPAPAPVASAGDNWYLLPDGRYFKDNNLPSSVKLPPGTRKLINYTLGGPLGHGRSAYSVVGKAWRAPTTFYVYAGKVVPGDQVDVASIPAGARVFYRP